MIAARFRKVLAWGFVLVAAVMVGALIFAYTYVTDSRTLVALIRSHAPRYFPTSALRVEHVQLRPVLGQIELTRATLQQTVGETPFATTSVPWIQIRCDTRALWQGKFEPQEVMVAQPVLRLKRRADGTWNLQDLLADPWPLDVDMQPVVRISKGSLELYEGEERSLILHDVELTFEPSGGSTFRFVGSAQGDILRHMELAGTLDVRTGRVTMSRCDFTGLALTDELRDRLPQEYRSSWANIGVGGGELDVSVQGLDWLPARGAPAGYTIGITLRGGAWTCPRLPFPIRDISCNASIIEGRLIVDRAEGRYGKTDLVVDAANFDLHASDPLAVAFSLDLTVRELELDANLRSELPDDVRAFWDKFTLEGRDDLGRISATAHIRRREPDAPIEQEASIELLDVAACYDGFRMPLEHMRGRMTLVGETLKIERIETLVGGQPLVVSGQVHDIATDPRIALDVTAGAIPIDEGGPFVRALPKSVADMITQFHPTGSVRGTAHVTRTPLKEGGGDPWGEVRVSATLDLNEGCSMRWDGLRYPVRRLTGRLELTPTGCVFSNVRGENGAARFTAGGRVEALDAQRFAADIRLIATKLRFDKELQDALPAEWQATWRVLNPIGTSKLDAHVVTGWHDRPDRTHMTIALDRSDEAQVKLEIRPAPGTPGINQGQVIQLPAMSGVEGVFEYDNGAVTMNDVRFNFAEARVGFQTGHMTLHESGALDLHLAGLGFKGLRLDGELRRVMPPLMATYAQKFDENRPLRGQGDVAITWNGNRAEPAVCSWENVKILFDDAKIFAGQAAIEHIQGELSGVSGRSDGQSLAFQGLVDVESMIIGGVQLSRFRSPIVVAEGRASLGDVSAKLLDGTLRGGLEITLSDRPEYRASATLTDADLARLAQSLPGRQELSGSLSARVELSGAGADLRQISGSGSAEISGADLGKLPWFLKLVSPLNASRERRAAFDSGHVAFLIKDGALELNPIKITGNTMSLIGDGTIDAQGEIDLRLTPLPGRDERFRIPVVSNLTREATTQVLPVRAKGPIGSPSVSLDPVPGVTHRVGNMMRRVTERERSERRR